MHSAAPPSSSPLRAIAWSALLLLASCVWCAQLALAADQYMSTLMPASDCPAVLSVVHTSDSTLVICAATAAGVTASKLWTIPAVSAAGTGRPGAPVLIAQLEKQSQPILAVHHQSGRIFVTTGGSNFTTFSIDPTTPNGWSLPRVISLPPAVDDPMFTCSWVSTDNDANEPVVVVGCHVTHVWSEVEWLYIVSGDWSSPNGPTITRAERQGSTESASFLGVTVGSTVFFDGGPLRIQEGNQSRIIGPIPGCSYVQNSIFDSRGDRLIFTCPDEEGISMALYNVSQYSLDPAVPIVNITSVIFTADQCVALFLAADPVSGAISAICSSGFIVTIHPLDVGLSPRALASPSQCAGTSPLSVWLSSFGGQVDTACIQGLVGLTDGYWAKLIAQTCSGPELEFDSTTGTAVALCRAGPHIVLRLEAGSAKPLLPREVCGQPIGQTVSLQVDTADGSIWASCSEGVTRIDTNGSVTRFLPQIHEVDALFLPPGGSTLWAGSINDGLWSVQTSGANPRLLIESSVCSGSLKVFVNSVGVLYVACASQGLLQLNPNATTPRILIPYEYCAVQDLVGHEPSQRLFVWCSSFLSGVFEYSLVTGNLTQILPDNPMCVSANGLRIIGDEFWFICSGTLLFSLSLLPSASSLPVPHSSRCPQLSTVTRDPVTNVMFYGCDNSMAADGTDYQCYPGSTWQFGECTPCPIGSYRNRSMVVARQLDCDVCLEGSVAPTAGAAECTVCAPGEYAVSPMMQCQKCPIGSYSDQPGSTSCDPCRAGSFGESTGLTTLHCSGPCLAGFWCGLGSTRAKMLACGSSSVYCPTGSFTPVPAAPGNYPDLPAVKGFLNTMTLQRPCPIGQFCEGDGPFRPCTQGRYQNDTGKDSCKPCPVGHHSSGTGAVECDLCSPGTFADAEGAILCTACSPGQFQNISGSNGCEACPVGRSANAAGFEECNLCPVGRSAASTKSIQCDSCATGRYQAEEGKTDCVDCPLGSFAFDFTSTECRPCAAGRYADQTKAASCTPCSQGSASNETALQTPCPLCQPGTAQATSGLTACDACTAYFFSGQSGALSCTKCDTLTNRNHTACLTNECKKNEQFDQLAGECSPCPLSQTSSAGGKCSSCPSNTYTPFVGSGCVSCDHAGMDGLTCAGGWISVNEGYWAHQTLRTIVVDGSSTSILLFQASKCPDGFCQGAQLQLESTNGTTPADSASFVASQCRYPRVSDDSNVLCGGCADGYIAWGDSCTSCSKVNGGLLFGYLLLSFALVLFLCRNAADSAAGYSVALLYFAQTAMLEVGPVKGWLNWIGLINFNGTNGVGCLAPFDPYEQTLMSLLMPIILLAEMMLVAFVHFALSRTRFGQTVAPDASLPSQLLHFLAADFSWSRYVGAAMSILLFCYTQATATCISYLTCVEVGDSKVVFSAPTMDCRSRTYRHFLIPVVFALVTYVVGFPFAVFGFLWSHRKMLASRESATSTFVARWSPLFQMYSAEAWYWQVTVLLRRAVFVILSVALVGDAQSRGLAFSLLNLASLLLQLRTRPFNDASVNSAEVVSHVLLVCLSMIISVHVTPYSIATQVVLFFIIVPTILVLCGLMLFQKTRSLQRLLREKSKRQGGTAAELEEPMGSPPSLGDSTSSSRVLGDMRHVSVALEDELADPSPHRARSLNQQLARPLLESAHL